MDHVRLSQNCRWEFFLHKFYVTIHPVSIPNANAPNFARKSYVGLWLCRPTRDGGGGDDKSSSFSIPHRPTYTKEPLVTANTIAGSVAEAGAFQSPVVGLPSTIGTPSIPPGGGKNAPAVLVETNTSASPVLIIEQMIHTTGREKVQINVVVRVAQCHTKPHTDEMLLPPR